MKLLTSLRRDQVFLFALRLASTNGERDEKPGEARTMGVELKYRDVTNAREDE